MRCRRCHASLPPFFTKKQKQKKPTTTTSTRVHLNWPPRIECIACSPPSVWLSVSLLLSPSLSVSTTLQTHYKNLFHKISMPAKNDISAARVIDLPKKQNSFAKMLLWPTDWRKSLRNIRELHKILEFQGASFTWQWERPQITVKANSARPNENENESPCCVSLVCSQCALHKASAAKAYW